MKDNDFGLTILDLQFIEPRTPNPEPRAIKFFCDRDVYRLAKWLRFAGFDTMTRQEMPIHKIEALCKKERRVFLTRNKGLKSFTHRYIILESNDYKEQLKQILSLFKMDKDKIATRCMKCNVLLKECIEKENQKYCPRCGKYFWKGTHYEMMCSVLGVRV